MEPKRLQDINGAKSSFFFFFFFFVSAESERVATHLCCATQACVFNKICVLAIKSNVKSNMSLLLQMHHYPLHYIQRVGETDK